MLVSIVAISGAISQSEPYSNCSVGIVGAGAGGVYFGWRLVKGDPSFANQICVFERLNRVGGRVYSMRGMGPRKNLVVEAGAYRFAPKPFDEYDPEGNFLRVIYTPLVSGLIKDHFHIPTALYEPGDPNSTLEKIVDTQQNDGGYDTFVKQMYKEAEELSVRFFFEHEVTNLTPIASANNSTQSFILGVRSLSTPDRPSFNVSVASVMLNLPQNPLLRLLRSDSTSSSVFHSQKNRRNFLNAVQSLEVPMPLAAVKLYVHYDDAWWLNYFNLTSGGFQSLEGMFSPTTSVCRGHWPCYPVPPQSPPLKGRYFDGDTRCDADRDGTSPACHGFLEATYSYMLDTTFFRNFELTQDPPVVVLHKPEPNDLSSSLQWSFVRTVHTALMRLHRDQLQALGEARGTALRDKIVGTEPSEAVLALWNSGSVGFEGGVHRHKQCANITTSTPSWLPPDPCVDPDAAVSTTLRPFPDMPLYVANEAFGPMPGWAEGSLVMAETVLHRFFGLEKPDWISNDTYMKYVLIPPPPSGDIE